jgi:hypothetical protein
MAGGRGLAWQRERTGVYFTEAAKGLAAVDSSGRYRGVVGYDQWTKNSVEAHMAVDTPIAWRTLLPHVFVWPFQHVGVILGIISASNVPSCRMVDALGFKQLNRIRDGWAPGEDLVLWEMRRENCSYLPDFKPQPRRGAWYRDGSPLR